MNILFLHSWNSVPGGVKLTCLKDHGHPVIIPKMPDENFDVVVAYAQAEFDNHKPEVVVRGFRGGAFTMNINNGKARLVNSI